MRYGLTPGKPFWASSTAAMQALHLNHREHRHDLTRRCLSSANRSEFRTDDLDKIMNKASCLSMLSNAVLVWNMVRIAEIVNHLPASGKDILGSDLARSRFFGGKSSGSAQRF